MKVPDSVPVRFCENWRGVRFVLEVFLHGDAQKSPLWPRQNVEFCVYGRVVSWLCWTRVLQAHCAHGILSVNGGGRTFAQLQTIAARTSLRGPYAGVFT